MATPWFEPNAWSWIPGTAIGVLGGIIGSLVGALAPRGKARGVVLGLVMLSVLFSAGLLIAGLVAYVSRQPFGIWYGFALPGVIGLLVFLTCFGVARRRYREAEMRRQI